MKEVNELSAKALSGLTVGDLFEYKGNQFAIGTIPHGVRHSSHGQVMSEDGEPVEKDGQPLYILRKYSRRVPVPQTIEGLLALFDLSEVIERVYTEYQYKSRQTSEPQILAALSEELPTGPNDLPVIVPGEFSLSTKKNLSEKAQKAVEDFITSKLGGDRSKLGKLVAKGGITLSEDSPNVQIHAWLMALEKEAVEAARNASLGL